jgi:hypothetical protein
MDFGIAAEGVTDQVTIQNILSGFFDSIEDLEQDITFVQPHEDASDENDVRGYGSWTSLFSYLKDKRFREDVLNTEHIIIQIDSDVCNKVGFDVSRVDESNKEIKVTDLINRIVARLVEQISIGDANFYTKHSKKIIFAVCVDSLECWIYKYYEIDSRKVKTCKIKGCETSLQQVISKSYKKLSTLKCAKEYEKLSKPFRKKKTINQIVNFDFSFEVFINHLDNLDYP